MANLLESIEGPKPKDKTEESSGGAQQPSTKPSRADLDARQLQIAKQLEAINAVLRQRSWAVNPDQWCEERLHEYVWSKQREILGALQKYRKVAVRSCHGVGKSFSSARVVAHWIDTNPPGEAFVVTSAPTAPQIRAILWRELGRAFTNGRLPGRMNQTEWFIEVNGKSELVAMGRKPDEYDPTAFQGIHAPKVLVVFDESNGIRGGLWEAADSLLANEDSKFLAIGNPDEAGTEFHEICKPGSGWHVIEINAFESPNFTGEFCPPHVAKQLVGPTYVEEKRRKWAPHWFWVDANGNPCHYLDGVNCLPPEGDGRSYDEHVAETNPLWQSKILGRFPISTSPFALIPLPWILDAQRRSLKPDYTDSSMGVDVGGGGDSSTTCLRAGDVYRITTEHQIPDTMITAGLVVDEVNQRWARGQEIHLVNVDSIGIGKGVADRGKELYELGDVRAEFQAINVGEAAVTKAISKYSKQKPIRRFLNKRAELYWSLRTRFENGAMDIDPDDEDLAGELMELRFKRLSSGIIQIESKDEAKRRGVPSPNRAEALMLSTAPKQGPTLTSATWGRK